MERERVHELLEKHPRIAKALTGLRSFLPPLNFITIHYCYFLMVPLAASVIFWLSSDPDFAVSYTDSLFLVVSAMTEAGLNTINLSSLTTWQQIILFLLILVGGQIWVSIWTVAFRRHVFEKRFKDIVREERTRRLRRANTSRLPLGERISVSFKNLTGGRPTPRSSRAPQQPEAEDVELVDLERDAAQPSAAPGTGPAPVSPQDGPSPPAAGPIIGSTTGSTTGSTVGRIAFAQVQHPNAEGESTSAASHPGAHSNNQLGPRARTLHRGPERIRKPAFFWSRPAGRHAEFHGLSTEDRERLGGCEYRAIKMLSAVVPVYFVLWQLLGCVGLGAWMARVQPGPADEEKLNPWWLGIFNGASAFNNSGMSLLDRNMIPFEEAAYPLLTMGLMILAGNTAYPIFLRLIFWTTLKTLQFFTDEDDHADTKETLEFILKYPRRVYTNLFPSRPTWWLLFMLVLLNSIDWAAFELMNFGNPIIESIPRGSRVLDGLFQALAVRSGGFYVVSISETYIGLQVLYVIMMYISVYPVVITMRHSNVYEERSLGIYADDPTSVVGPEDGQRARSGPLSELGQILRRTLAPWHGVGVAPLADGRTDSRISFVSQQIHGQLAHDLWWLVLAVLAISTLETANFLGNPAAYSVFNVIFEVVSAYGCVGISVGLPDVNYSFSGGWGKASKLVLCAVMLRGRHRGLPVALDRAVRLPGEQLLRDDEDDYRIRRSMTSRRISAEHAPLD